MNTLAAWLIAAQFARRRTTSLLSLLAIALGVALGYAIHLINDTALADFRQALRSVQGEPHAIVAPRDTTGSVELALVEELTRDPAVLVVAPVIEVRVRVDQHALPVRLIGLDVFSAPAVMPALLPEGREAQASRAILDGGVYASPALLAKLALAPGDHLSLWRGNSRWPAILAGQLPGSRPGDLLLVADIAWVQAHFGPPAGVGEARIRLAPGVDATRWRQALAERLPSDLLIRSDDDDSARVSNLSRAYRVNLNVLALVALLTGAFLVFANQLTAVAQRASQFALLGVLGLSPRRLMLQILGEALAIGLPGALLGLALGYALATAFTQTLGGDLGGGYFSGSAPTIIARPLPALGFLALGCAASLAGAAYPAWLNRQQDLAQALKSGFAEETASSSARHLWLPTVLGVLAYGLAQLPPVGDLPLAGYASIAILLVMGITAAPWLTQRVFAAGAELPLAAHQRIALQNVAQAPLLAQVAASGLIVSFALTISMVTMVSSFRLAVDRWLDEVLPAPLYLRGKATPLPDELLAALRQPDSPFARLEQTMHAALALDVQRPNVALIVREIDRDQPEARLPFTGAVSQAPPTQPVVWISEATQELYRLHSGQRVRLPLLGREVEVFIGGVWRDYVRQFGAIVISRSDYERLGGRFAASDLALWPQAGHSATAAAWLAPLAARFGCEVADAGEIRQLSLSIFDQSFAVTHALEAAAMLIGLFGLAVTLAANVWLRARELATLGALGFDHHMLSQAVILEGVLIALVGLLIGLACGIAIGAVLTYVINPQAFHWRMTLSVPWSSALAGAALTLAAATVASCYAARQATRLPLAQILADAQ